MKKRKLNRKLAQKLLWICLAAIPNMISAQIGVGTTTPHPSAAMEIAAGAGNNKGMVIPKISSQARISLDSTQNIAQGLIFFDTDLQKFYYFNQSPSKWYEVDNDWNRKDVAGPSPIVGTHIYLGVLGNVGIGTASFINPAAKLTVVGNGVIGDQSFTAAPAPASNSLAVQSWVGIGTRTRTPGKLLDVKGEMNVRGFTAQLDVVSTVTASRFLGTSNLNQGEGMVENGTVIMYYGVLTGNFVNGLGTGEYYGWALCDGRNNTPDLRGQFVVGASNTDGNSYVYVNSERNLIEYRNTTAVGRGVDSTGGMHEVIVDSTEMANHFHPSSTTDTTGNHTHPYNSPNGCYDLALVSQSGCFFARPNDATTTSSSGTHTHSYTLQSNGGDQPHENRPPYFTLAYIMKLP